MQAPTNPATENPDKHKQTNNKRQSAKSKRSNNNTTPSQNSTIRIIPDSILDGPLVVHTVREGKSIVLCDCQVRETRDENSSEKDSSNRDSNLLEGGTFLAMRSGDSGTKSNPHKSSRGKERFLGNQESPMSMYGLKKGECKKLLDLDFIRYCANEKCYFNTMGLPTTRSFKTCNMCGTLFCSSECHSMAWKQRQSHYYYCKINSCHYQKLSLAKKKYGDNAYYFAEMLLIEKEMLLIESSEEYKAMIQSLKLTDEQVSEYKNILNRKI